MEKLLQAFLYKDTVKTMETFYERNVGESSHGLI